MSERPRTDLPLVRGVQDSAPSPESAAADAFGCALDELLRAWTDGDDLSREQVLRRHPSLVDDLDALFELAREIAVVRPPRLPTVPGYDVLDEVGRGGMGVVYRARQHGLQRIVALKLLPDAAGDARGRARFLAEARGLGRVRHAHVVTIHEVVETADQVAYAMEWIDGRSLASLLEELAGWPRRGAVPPVRFSGGGDVLPDPAVPWFCRAGIAIARALGEVHRHGLVHRDVKPGNVLLRADGTALLSDFGLVRAEQLGLTRTGQVVGTPAFAAPEQLRGSDDVGAAADVWGLGATLHCALAGQVPFAGRTPMELLANIETRRRRPLTAQGLPKDLETIVARCLEAEPRDRYASADAVADDLENLLALRPVQARPLGAIARGWRLLRRNRRMVVAAAGSGMLVLAACALLALWVWNAITLPERFDAALLQARFALLEPTHEERVELADQGQPTTRVSAFARSGDQALAAYAEALRIDGSRGDVRCERDTVALAQALLQKAPASPSPDLLRAAPTACAIAADWARGQEPPMPPLDQCSDADRRSLGLLAFLTDRATACHAAWAPLDLAGDPFVDAAAGQMHLQREEAGKAYARLARAAQVWPQAGFLAVGLADCAVRLGDLDVAERELARAQQLAAKNPFDTDVRVRADLLAARGEFDTARRDYEWLLVHHVATTARRHYARMLERTGDLGRLLVLHLDRASASSPDEAGHRIVSTWRWWTQCSRADRVQEFDRLFGERAETAKLYQLAVALPQWFDSAERRTPRHATGSDELHGAIEGLTFLMELTLMNQSSRVHLQNVSPVVRRGVIAILGFLSGARTLRIPGVARTSALCIAVASTLLTDVASTQSTVHWTNATPALPANSPQARRSHMTAIDPLTGDVLVCGGFDDNTNTQLTDMWKWNGVLWSLVGTNPSTGFPLSSASMVNVDSINSVLLFGGGNFSGYLQQSWIWDGTAWTNVTSSGINPPARASFGMTYDSLRDRVVIHGGIDFSNAILHDTWEWNPATMTWGQVSTTGPGVYDFGMAFDPALGETVLQGGYNGSAHQTATWAWRGSNWSQRASLSGARWTQAMAWDDSRQRIVMFGGATGSALVASAHEWDGSGWVPETTSSPTAPTGRSYVRMAFHPASQRMVLFGGFQTPPASASQETWTFTTQSAPRVDPTGPGCTSTTTNLTPALSRLAGTGPWVNGTLTLRADNLASLVTFPQYLHVLLVDVANPNLPLAPLAAPGCLQLADTNLLLYTLNHGGFASVDLPPIPNLVGLQFHAQAATLNLTGVPYFVDAVSNGLQFTIGTR